MKPIKHATRSFVMRSAHILKYITFYFHSFETQQEAFLRNIPCQRLVCPLHSVICLRFVSMCVYIYVYVCIHVRMYACIHVLRTYVFMYVYITNPNIVFSANQLSHQHPAEGPRVMVRISCLLDCSVVQYLHKFSKLSKVFIAYNTQEILQY